jgi:predicted lysophospholipase L1 biosynthesis ABC-type transport system permease subunit
MSNSYDSFKGDASSFLGFVAFVALFIIFAIIQYIWIIIAGIVVIAIIAGICVGVSNNQELKKKKEQEDKVEAQRISLAKAREEKAKEIRIIRH